MIKVMHLYVKLQITCLDHTTSIEFIISALIWNEHFLIMMKVLINKNNFEYNNKVRYNMGYMKDSLLQDWALFLGIRLGGMFNGFPLNIPISFEMKEIWQFSSHLHGPISWNKNKNSFLALSNN